MSDTPAAAAPSSNAFDSIMASVSFLYRFRFWLWIGCAINFFLPIIDPGVSSFTNDSTVHFAYFGNDWILGIDLTFPAKVRILSNDVVSEAFIRICPLGILIFLPVFVQLGLAFAKKNLPITLNMWLSLISTATMILTPFLYFPVITNILPNLGFSFRPSFPLFGWLIFVICGLAAAAGAYGTLVKDKRSAIKA